MSSVQAPASDVFSSESAQHRWASVGQHDFPTKARTSLNWFERIARSRMRRWLDGIEGGLIRFSDRETSEMFGEVAPELSATWSIHHPEFYRHLATHGSVGAGESYLRGQWQTDDLTTLLRILCRNLHRMPSGTSPLASLTNLLSSIYAAIDGNSRSGSRRNIAQHYDLSNEFFALFLDPKMMYSSAWFDSPECGLEQASIAKLDRICDKLELNPADHVAEIGTGWGGFAIHAADRHGCRVTTTTISREQYLEAERRIDAAGLKQQIELLGEDYRDMSGTYDKLASIEMIEAVGYRYLDRYFEQCGRLLKPGGRFLLQAIVIPEQRFDSYRRSNDYIRKYIFPGGFLPSIAAIQNSVGRASKLCLRSVDDMSEHYAQTLMHWRNRFWDRIADVRQLGFDDRFIRMWEYYLCYCEAAFRERAVGVVQMLWDQPKR